LINGIYFVTTFENREQAFEFSKTYASSDIVGYLNAKESVQ
jgi:hypothetical protein